MSHVTDHPLVPLPAIAHCFSLLCHLVALLCWAFTATMHIAHFVAFVCLCQLSAQFFCSPPQCPKLQRPIFHIVRMSEADLVEAKELSWCYDLGKLVGFSQIRIENKKKLNLYSKCISNSKVLLQWSRY